MAQPSNRSIGVIVSLDLVGYSRLTEQDEIGTHRALMACMRKRLTPIVSEHQGVVIKLTGDGALVRFPKASRAVHAMIRFQREVTASEACFPPSRRLEFRIGMHVGPAIFDDGDVYGHGVNLAVRLQETAEPGSIFFSHAVFQRLDAKAMPPFVKIGGRTLKNIKAQTDIHCWRPEGRRPAVRSQPFGGLVAAVLLTNMILPTAALNTIGPSDDIERVGPVLQVERDIEHDDRGKRSYGLRGRPLEGGVKATLAAAERSLENRREIAEDAYLQALALYGRHTPAAFARALNILDEALGLQSDDSSVHALLAALYWGGRQNRWQFGRGMTREDMLRRARNHLSRATASSPLAHMVRS